MYMQLQEIKYIAKQEAETTAETQAEAETAAEGETAANQQCRWFGQCMAELLRTLCKTGE